MNEHDRCPRAGAQVTDVAAVDGRPVDIWWQLSAHRRCHDCLVRLDGQSVTSLAGLPVLGAVLSFTALCGWAAGSVGHFAAGSAAITAAIGVAFVSAIAALAVHAAITAYICGAPAQRRRSVSGQSFAGASHRPRFRTPRVVLGP